LTKKMDIHTDLLREILAELRRLNANLERRVTEQNIMSEGSENEAEDMNEFE